MVKLATGAVGSLSPFCQLWNRQQFLSNNHAKEEREGEAHISGDRKGEPAEVERWSRGNCGSHSQSWIREGQDARPGMCPQGSSEKTSVIITNSSSLSRQC